MDMLREIPVETPDGRARITLWHGDLTRLPPELAVDMLLVSAWPNSYRPSPGTLIGALRNAGLSVEHLARDKEADLRETSGFWLSKPLGATGLNIGRILCFEHAPLGTPTGLVGEVFRNLGPFLPDSGARIATPLLASGNQSWPVEMVLPAMIGAAAEWMRRGLEIRELMIVAIDRARAEACAGIIDDLRSERGGPLDDLVRGVKDGETVVSLARQVLSAERRTTVDVSDFEELLEKPLGAPRPAPVPEAPPPVPPREKPPAAPKESAQKVIARNRPPRVRIDYDGEDRPYDVFVSYTTRDRAAAEALCAAVRDVWPDARIFDYRQEIDQSLFWQQAIDDAIEDCGKVIAVLSPEYFASPECTEEIMIARLRNKRAGGGVLLPVYWRSLDGDLALWLQIINYADCRECDPARLKAFAAKIGPAAAAGGAR